MRSDIPLLETVKVAAPCSASWEQMRGDEQTRYCAGCQRHVHNLSAMSRRDAENLLRQSRGKRVCIRYGRRPDGSLITDNCPRRFRPVRALLLKRLTALMSFGLLLFNLTSRAAEAMHRQTARRQASAKPTGNKAIARKQPQKQDEIPVPVRENQTDTAQLRAEEGVKGKSSYWTLAEEGKSAEAYSASEISPASSSSGAIFTTGVSVHF